MITRHDVDASLYLAEPNDFPAIFAVDSFREEIFTPHDNIDELLKPNLLPMTAAQPKHRIRCDGMGMLIAPNWILTAAHVATELSKDKRIDIEETPYSVQQIVVHPKFQDYTINKELAEHDIALIQLKKSVETVAPLALYSQTDECDEEVTFVGRGDFGNGLTGPDRVDGKLRMATNIVEQVDEQYLIFTFDAPPDCTDLEGISGPGDSGGPALIQTENGWAIAGISSGQIDHGLGEGHYGVTEYYTRVSQYIDWIHATIQG